jgi:hypothetical protein
MAIPSRKQTYGYTDCRDLVEKLDREIDRYSAVAGKHAADEEEMVNIVFQLTDSAFNASVTAEQLADWVFNDMTEVQRSKFGFKELADMQKLVREKCRALYLIRHAATASKHWIVSKHADPTVEVFVTGEGGWNAYFMDDGIKKDAYVVFCDAREFWYHFINDNQIAAWDFNEIQK